MRAEADPGQPDQQADQFLGGAGCRGVGAQRKPRSASTPFPGLPEYPSRH